jgi:membrane-bound lytic murein transglycosylase F
MLHRLGKGEGDLVAAGMPPAPGSAVPALFSRGHLDTRQYLVLRRGRRKISSLEELAGKTVHVAQGSIYQQTLEKLQSEGIAVEIVALDGVPAEELIRMVADGEVAATVAHDYIIGVNRRYYPRATAALAIEASERLAWAVPPNAGELLARIDRFFEKISRTGLLDKIYQRYYGVAEQFEYVEARYFERRIKTRLPKYRALIEAAAQTYGFDWRLIAAMIYQESHFDPEARSPADAVGLMQLTPATAAGLGVLDPLDPADNIQAGVAHLKYLYEHFNQLAGPDRLKIALASYNIGVGHIFDARTLARQKGLDPNQWDSLVNTLPLLAYPRYYRKATYGYGRGIEAVRYVDQVFSYYEILKRREIGNQSCDPRDLTAIK